MDEYPIVEDDDWPFMGFYPQENAAEVLPNLSPEGKALMMKIMQKCLQEHDHSHIYPGMRECNCEDIVDCDCDYCTKYQVACSECEFYDSVSSLEEWNCCDLPLIDPFVVDESGRERYKYFNPPEVRKAHKWGPENIRITFLAQSRHGDANAYGHDLYVELLYTHGSAHEWVAAYGVSTITEEISCYAD